MSTQRDEGEHEENTGGESDESDEAISGVSTARILNQSGANVRIAHDKDESLHKTRVDQHYKREGRSKDERTGTRRIARVYWS